MGLYISSLSILSLFFAYLFWHQITEFIGTIIGTIFGIFHTIIILFKKVLTADIGKIFVILAFIALAKGLFDTLVWLFS